MISRLLERIDSRTAKVAVLGVGYVGLPLAIAIARAGFSTLGFDVNRARIAQLRSGNTGYAHLANGSLVAGLQSGLTFSADQCDLRGFDVYILCVPTPLDAQGAPDLSFVSSAAAIAAAAAASCSLVSLESTTYPGTTRDLVCAALEHKGLSVGSDVFVCYSPEREDPGRVSHDVSTTPKLVGGVTANCGVAGQAFYSAIVTDVITLASPEAAEMAKLMENTYRAVNIALANELKGICDTLGVDFYAAMDAASTKPYGFMPFYPGPGVGGHCIPIDPVYLTWRTNAARGGQCALIEAALRVNAHAHERALQALETGLKNEGKALSASLVLLVGAAYKPKVSDTRESPFFRMLDELEEHGAAISYCDPLVPRIEHKGRRYSTTANFDGFDAAVIVTDQVEVDYVALQSALPLIIDCRRSYHAVHRNVIRA